MHFVGEAMCAWRAHDVDEVLVTVMSTAQLLGAAMRQEHALHSKVSIGKVLAVVCPMLSSVSFSKQNPLECLGLRSCLAILKCEVLGCVNVLKTYSTLCTLRPVHWHLATAQDRCIEEGV